MANLWSIEGDMSGHSRVEGPGSGTQLGTHSSRRSMMAKMRMAARWFQNGLPNEEFDPLPRRNANGYSDAEQEMLDSR